MRECKKEGSCLWAANNGEVGARGVAGEPRRLERSWRAACRLAFVARYWLFGAARAEDSFSNVNLFSANGNCFQLMETCFQPMEACFQLMDACFDS